MDGASTQGLECFEMNRSTVTFVCSKSVPGPTLIKLEHQIVAGDFGDDRASSNSGAAAVATNDCPGRVIDVGSMRPIDQDKVGSSSQQ